MFVASTNSPNSISSSAFVLIDSTDFNLSVKSLMNGSITLTTEFAFSINSSATSFSIQYY